MLFFVGAGGSPSAAQAAATLGDGDGSGKGDQGVDRVRTGRDYASRVLQG